MENCKSRDPFLILFLSKKVLICWVKWLLGPVLAWWGCGA